MRRMISFTLPIRLVSEANQRDHWVVRNERKKNQQMMVKAYSGRLGNMPLPSSMRIILTRFGKRKMDSDNLAGSFKHVQDALAKIIGIDDGSDKLTWVYRQEIGEYVVRVEIEKTKV
jgi:hypothetical protein